MVQKGFQYGLPAFCCYFDFAFFDHSMANVQAEDFH